LALLIHRKASKEQFFTYLFFACWAFIGLVAYLQIIPLDMTACETWFYFSMVGWLGMIGVILVTYQSHIHPKWFFIIAILLIGILGVRTAFRGLDYRNPLSLAYKNISVSKEDYVAYNQIAGYLLEQNEYSQAEVYAAHSVHIFPATINYNDLGYALGGLGNYSGAMNAYDQGLKYGSYYILYENLGELTLVYGNPSSNKQFLLNSLKLFPQDSKLWMYLAILEENNNDTSDAKYAIANAAADGQISQVMYNSIMYNQLSALKVANLGKTIYIK
jgi:tetratricopeptide (TPR) repeat protein